MAESTETEIRYVGLFRRLFAIFYDTFLLTAILLVIAATIMTINHGEPIETDDSFRPAYVFFMISICYLYFAWFWVHGGQTLGMKTWRISLQSDDGKNISWKIAAIRFFSAIVSWGIFGLGFLWSFFDKKNRCWHDLSSKTVLVDLR
ncbi:MAG: RDD family protein [Gammaproteobacteria bacterium]|nr:RDD family protein [Gammaproteobacteria bacterium]